jgi:hypothetical protein
MARAYRTSRHSSGGRRRSLFDTAPMRHNPGSGPNTVRIYCPALPRSHRRRLGDHSFMPKHTLTKAGAKSQRAHMFGIARTGRIYIHVLSSRPEQSRNGFILVSRPVLKRCPCSRSTFNEPNSVSLQALSSHRRLDYASPAAHAAPLVPPRSSMNAGPTHPFAEIKKESSHVPHPAQVQDPSRGRHRL